VAKVKTPEDMSIDELRQLMVEKRRRIRLRHLEQFRKTGRVVNLTSDQGNTSLGNLHSTYQAESDLDANLPWHKRAGRTLDRVFLAIEILAVIGLLFIIYSGIKVLHNLNEEFTQSLIPATLTPTPLINAIVLPSGHTPPDSSQAAQPNDAEIPAHLLPLYQSMAQLPIPTPGPEQAVQIQIPAINVDAPVVQGDNWEQLKKGVAQHTGSADPGQAGNLVLSAHDDIYGEIFRHLDQLQQGDEVVIYTATRSFTYVVASVQIVSPTSVEVMAQTPNPTVTLISCYPYMVDNQRIVVQAILLTGNE
jgi:sortase A